MSDVPTPDRPLPSESGDAPAVEQLLFDMQRWGMLGRLIADVAHHFGDQLTVLLGYGDLLAAAVPPGTPAGDYVRKMCRAADRAADLTRQLLDFARPANGPTGVADVSCLARQVGDLLGRLLCPRVQVVTQAEGPGTVAADGREVELVIVNLVLNARDALPAGGRIDVCVAPVRLDRPLRHDLGTVAPGVYVRVRVRDNGRGMAPAARRNLFRPFFTTKPRAAGLGLAAVARVVRRWRGAITVESAPGAGTTIDVYLPAKG
jgi:signal transduction histidine kinase